MSYELWCFKDRSATSNQYVLLDANSDASSSISRTIQDAFATFGAGSVPMHQRSQARPFYTITPVAYLENYCNDHPELIL